MARRFQPKSRGAAIVVLVAASALAQDAGRLAEAQALLDARRDELLAARKTLTPKDCLARRAEFPSIQVRVEPVDEFDEPARGVTYVGSDVLAYGAFETKVPACLAELIVAFPGRGKMRWVALSLEARQVMRVAPQAPATTATTIGTSWVISGFTEFSVVTPGWGEGDQSHLGVGARSDGWWRVFHVSAGLKLTSYSSFWLRAAPLLPALDFFVGAGPSFTVGGALVHVVADLGVWSTHIPTARVAVGVRTGNLFLTGEASLHFYPRAFQPDETRPLTLIGVPFERFLFFSFGVAAGWCFR